MEDFRFQLRAAPLPPPAGVTLGAKEVCFAAQGVLNPHRKTQPRTVSSFLISTHVWWCQHQSCHEGVLARLRPRGAGAPEAPQTEINPSSTHPGGHEL